MTERTNRDGRSAAFPTLARRQIEVLKRFGEVREIEESEVLFSSGRRGPRQAGTSSRIENYLGFSAELSGSELTSRAMIQADKFGAFRGRARWWAAPRQRPLPRRPVGRRGGRGPKRDHRYRRPLPQAGRADGSRWPLARDPFLLETSLPGMFAAGDARSGSVKHVASAVGEGSMAVRFVHQYLSERRAEALSG